MLLGFLAEVKPSCRMLKRVFPPLEGNRPLYVVAGGENFPLGRGYNDKSKIQLW